MKRPRESSHSALDDEVVESQPDSQERQESVPDKEAEVPRAEIIGSEFKEQFFTDVKECVRYTRKQKRRQRKILQSPKREESWRAR